MPAKRADVLRGRSEGDVGDEMEPEADRAPRSVAALLFRAAFEEEIHHFGFEALAEFARSVAAVALETGRDQVLEPMNSADRKVVHDTVAGIDGVATTSEGEDPRRRVVIRRA